MGAICFASPVASPLSRLAGGILSHRLKHRTCGFSSPLCITLLSCGVSAFGARGVARSMVQTNHRSPLGGGVCSLQVEQFPCLSDNYGYLIHDAETGTTAAVDTPDPQAYMSALKRLGWTLHYILNTHHHHDHAGWN